MFLPKISIFTVKTLLTFLTRVKLPTSIIDIVKMKPNGNFLLNINSTLNDMAWFVFLFMHGKKEIRKRFKAINVLGTWSENLKKLKLTKIASCGPFKVSIQGGQTYDKTYTYTNI